MYRDSLMFEFGSEADAALAADTLEELGYEPHEHTGGRVHIHVRNEDLTSALEIMQCHGGRIVERAPAQISEITDDAYGLDAIPIPAHTVNEDWEGHYSIAEPAAADTGGERFPADDAPYDRFDAT